jgi:DNA gyrase subunit A
MGRTASGVRGIRLRDGDHVVGADAVTDPEDVLLTVTDQGFGKRTPVGNFGTQGRGGQGVRAHRLPEARGELLNGFLVSSGDEVLLITDGGVIIRTSVDAISTQGRDASGVRVMDPGADNRVAAVARVLATDDADTDDDPEAGENDRDGGPGGADDREGAAADDTGTG